MPLSPVNIHHVALGISLVSESLIAAVFGLLGALIGGGVSVVTTWMWIISTSRPNVGPQERDSLQSYSAERLQLYTRILVAGKNLGQAADLLFSCPEPGERLSLDQIRDAQKHLSEACNHFNTIADEALLIGSPAVRKAVGVLPVPLLILGGLPPEKAVEGFQKASEKFYDRLREFVVQARSELRAEAVEGKIIEEQ